MLDHDPMVLHDSFFKFSEKLYESQVEWAQRKRPRKVEEVAELTGTNNRTRVKEDWNV
jgi:hypothetical protein